MVSNMSYKFVTLVFVICCLVHEISGVIRRTSYRSPTYSYRAPSYYRAPTYSTRYTSYYRAPTYSGSGGSYYSGNYYSGNSNSNPGSDIPSSNTDYNYYNDYSTTDGGYYLTTTQSGADVTLCQNYKTLINGSYQGYFTCPRPSDPADYTMCCGDSNGLNGYCCKSSPNNNLAIIIGCSVGGGVLLIIIIVTTVVCCTCMKKKNKKVDDDLQTSTASESSGSQSVSNPYYTYSSGLPAIASTASPSNVAIIPSTALKPVKSLDDSNLAAPPTYSELYEKN